MATFDNEVTAGTVRFLPIPPHKEVGANIFTLKADAYLLTDPDNALVILDPENTGTLTTNKNSWVVNINGGLVSTHTALVLYNFLGTTANVVNVGLEGSIGGDNTGIFSSTATNINNSGQIGGSQFGIDFNGFVDFDTNGGPTGDGVPDGKFDSNLTIATKLVVDNKAGADILSDFIGVNNYSNAFLTVKNANWIEGGQSFYVDVDNDGNDDTVYEGAAITSRGGLDLNNALTGTIEGGVESGWINTKIVNAGQINGTITRYIDNGFIGGANNDVLDTDKDGFFADTGGFANINVSKNFVTNTGTITGTWNYAYDNNGTGGDDSDDGIFQVAIDFGRGADEITNSGKIFGTVWTGGDNDKFVNNATGIVWGRVRMDDGNDIFDNKGTLYRNFNDHDANNALGGPYEESGVVLGNGTNIFTNSGEIHGFVEANEGNDTFTNTLTGNIHDWVNLGDGLNKVSNSGRINEGYDGGSGVDDITNTVTGHIFGHVYTGQGNDKVTNAGILDDGLNVQDGDDTVINTGTIFNGIDAGDGRNILTNSGKLFGDFNSGHAGAAVIVGTAKTQELIVNSGLIDGGIFTRDGDRKITNSGIILDDIETGRNFDLNEWYATGNDELINSKEVRQVRLGNGNNIITNTGSIINGVRTGIGTDIINNNAGFIRDGVQTGKGNDTVINKAIIYNGVQLDSGLDDIKGTDGIDSLTNDATGKIYGQVEGGDGTNTYTNKGVINGDIFGGMNTDTLTNLLTIFGNVELFNGTNSVTNEVAGIIRGDVQLGNDGNTVTNKGIIDGNIESGDGIDVITNTKTILGNVDTGNGGDIVTNTTGTIGGDINLGGGADTFNGGAGAERLFDDLGADTYLMLGGDDHVWGSDDSAVDTFNGGLGIDELDLWDVDKAFTINLSTATQTLTIGATVDNVAGFEKVWGSNQFAHNDTLIGSNGADWLGGGDGGDTFTGGLGADRLFAGWDNSGNTDGDTDIFIYNLVTESGKTRATRDTIYGFEDGTDKIKFGTSFDADTLGNATIDAFQTGAFTGMNVAFAGGGAGAHGEIRAINIGAQTIIEVDTNGDKVADFQVALQGIHTLAESDFLFV